MNIPKSLTDYNRELLSIKCECDCGYARFFYKEDEVFITCPKCRRGLCFSDVKYRK